MEFVVDTNIIFSAIVKDSLTRLLLSNPDFVLYAPEALISELYEHRNEIKEKSGLNEKKWKELISIILSKIKIIPKEEIAPSLKQALKFSPEQEDAPFLALSLAKGIPLWSNDKALKRQPAVKVLSTAELMVLLGK